MKNTHEFHVRMHIFAPKTTIKKLFLASLRGFSLSMATPKKIYEIVPKNIVLNVNKYFKEEAMYYVNTSVHMKTLQ